MEEERQQKKDDGGRLEEARHEDARLEEAVEQEAEQREPTMIIQKECVDCTLPTAAIIKESTERLNGGLQKHPSSPLKHRTICPACQNCSVKPFQVLKFKQMNDVLRMSQDSGYNYLCLSGVHIRKVDGVWKLTDGTIFHTELELTNSIDSIHQDTTRGSANRTEGLSIASKVKKEKSVKLIGGICCHWIPGNGGKWRVTQFIEVHLQPMLNSEDEHLRPISSSFLGASATEIDCGGCSQDIGTCDQPAHEKLNGVGIPKPRNLKLKNREADAPAKGSFSSQKPSHEMYLPKEILAFRETYVVSLGKVVASIGQQYSDVRRLRFPHQVGDDSVNIDLGWLVRRDFCTALFSLVLHDVKRDNSMARFLLGSTKYSIWSLMKDVSKECVEESALQKLVVIIEQSPFLLDDDLRARSFVCETLNWYNEAFTEKLLIIWLRNFMGMQHIIDKYFEKSSIWKRPGREVAAVAHETLSILGQLNQFRFNLHADFEHMQLALQEREQNSAFIEQRETAYIDMEVAKIE